MNNSILMDDKIQDDNLPRRNAKKEIILGVLAAFLFIGLSVLCAYYTCFSDTDNQMRTGATFLNHFAVDNESITYSKFSMSFIMKRDPNPDFNGDIVNLTSENPELMRLKATIKTESDHRLHILISDANKERWQVPFIDENILQDNQDKLLMNQRADIQNCGFKLEISRFSYSFFDRDDTSTTSAILSTQQTYFRFMEKYISFEFNLPTDRIFGLGERISNFSLREGTYTLFNRDQGTPIENRKNPGHNLYGTHPFLMYQLKNGLFAGIFFKNSNAMQVSVGIQGGSSKVRFTAVGGVIDLYVFYKGKAQFILQQFHEIIGKPALPPFWALGYHYGKMGSNGTKDLRVTLEKFINNNFPIDAFWVDSSILESGKNFILNEANFSDIKNFAEYDLKMQHIHMVPVLEPGLKEDKNYSYFSNSKSFNGLARNSSNMPLIGKTHIGNVGYPNFFHKSMQLLWKEGVKSFSEKTGLDGFWLNLNEYSNQCNGECQNNNASSPYDDIPFVPGNTQLNKSTLSMSALYSANNTALDNFLVEFNVHSCNSLLMSNFTSQGLQTDSKNNSRVFLATRSSFPGIQKFAVAHWFGEMESNWEHFMHSLPSITSFQMFGIPLVGSLIGGFSGNTTEELYSTWAQMGALYPLTLNFNNNDPFLYTAKTLIMFKNAIRTKYSLARFIYTTIFEQALVGGTAIQPLFFEFPFDEMAYRTSDRVLLYGKGLMITTPLQKGQQKYSVYFPNQNWYKFPIGEQFVTFNPNKTEGCLLQVDTSIESPNIFVRGGMIFPYQDAISLKIRNMEELKESPMTLLIALDENNQASGRMVVDDGISADSIGKKNYRHYSFQFSNKTLKVMLLEGYNTTNETVPTYGFESFINVQIWGANFYKNISSACIISNTMGRRGIKVEYNQAKNILTLFDINKRKLFWRSIETVAFFADDDYNYCMGGFVASKIKITDQLRRMTALLETSLDLSERKYKMEAILLNDFVLNLKISPTNWKAWEVPGVIDANIRNTTKGSSAFAEYMFAISTDPDPFYFVVANPGDPEDTTITTQDLPIVLNEHFIEVSTLIKASEIYGIGERTQTKFSLNTGIYTIFSSSAEAPFENGEPPGKSTYGSHPFYMFKMPDNSFAGVFLLNSNAMDISVLPFDEGVYKVDHVSTGGLIDMFIIQRGVPKMIIEQYHNIIGKPRLFPIWAFGNHQSRLGYSTQNKLLEVVNSYARAGLPLDGLWADIDYMEEKVPFTLDQKRYPSIKAFVDHLHNESIKFIPIVEPFVAVNQPNEAYRLGLEKNVFIKRGDADSSHIKYPHVLGIVWPGYSAFIDFASPSSKDYWMSLLEKFNSSLIPFDGLWLSMNEMANFCDGECDLDGSNKNILAPGNKRMMDLPYIPGHRNMEHQGLPLDAEHFSPSAGDKQNYIEFNLHSMNGHMQLKATSDYFLKHKIRPFVMSRSTFPGSGRYGGHWLGDNKSLWPYLKASIVGIYNFQMFGIPFTGADVCGFSGNATIELCRRWYQLAAFYPFCRNNNDNNTVDQEPYSNSYLRSTANIALHLRYSLIRYIYNLHFLTTLHGGTYFMPLFFEFPNDKKLYEKPENSFLLGSSLKITPVLEQGQKHVISYFPNWNWYDFFTGLKVVEYKEKSKEGVTLQLEADLYEETINVHMRGGKIIPSQDTLHRPVLNTEMLKDIETSLIVAADHKDKAEGLLIFDEDENLDTNEYTMFNFTYEKGRLLVEYGKKEGWRKPSGQKNERLGEIIMFNARPYLKVEYGCATLHNGEKMKLDVIYDSRYEKLIMKPNGILLFHELHSIIWDGAHVTC